MNCNIKDVARRAGVSVGTVSRVINGSDNVAVQRVAAVQAAISELGYQKNFAAQLLAGKRGGSCLRTGNIGFWMAEMGDDWIANSIYMNYLSGIESVCAKRGYHVLIEHGGNDAYPRCVYEGKVDGLVVKATNKIPDNLTDINEKIPVIGLSMLDRRLPLSQVSMDNVLAGEEVCAYLWERGHRRIAFACFSSYHQMFFDRRTGYELFLARHGAFDPDLMHCFFDNHPQKLPETNFSDMSQIVDALLANSNPPTAIIAANDWMAAGLYEALAGHGLRIPDDVSVIGFDHLTNLFLRPRLTSFETPMRSMGTTAAEWLLDLLDNDTKSQNNGPSFRMAGGEIIEHDSVATLTQ